jgi:glycerophosphoryl diester phosphodiesterase
MSSETLRPFYVIGHNTNTIDDVIKALARGANAIEPDVQWNPHRHELCINHDRPSLGIFTPPSVDDYLEQLAQIAHNNPQLALVMFDSKLDRAEQGDRLSKAIHTHLSGLDLNIIINVAHLNMVTFFSSIAGQLGAREA